MTRQVLYTSRETGHLSFNEIGDLLERSRRWNHEHEITGLLLHAPNGNFVQMLEGEDKDIEAVLLRITADDRHEQVKILIDQTVDRRVFPDWEMGFANLLCADQSEVESYIREVLSSTSEELELQLIPVFLMASIHDANADTSLVPLMLKTHSSDQGAA